MVLRWVHESRPVSLSLVEEKHPCFLGGKHLGNTRTRSVGYFWGDTLLRNTCDSVEVLFWGTTHLEIVGDGDDGGREVCRSKAGNTRRF